MLRLLYQRLIGGLLPFEARCNCCRARYARAQPFVEGPTGFLVCCGCIGEFHELLQAPQFDDTPPLSGPAVTNANPFASPLARSRHVGQCALCIRGDIELVAYRRTRLCRECIDESQRLLDEQSSKGDAAED